MTGPITIDGSAGGGQMLRNAVALSAVRGRAVRVTNIRGARPRPGLRPQHLLAVRAVAAVCGAELTGAEIGSREIEFRPGEIAGKTDWRLDVGTAGSVLLVLQSLLPALAVASAPSELTLVGGTDVPFAPPFEHFQHVFLAALAGIGPRVEATLVRRGFYPKGGGELHVRVEPCGPVGQAGPEPRRRELALCPSWHFAWIDRGSVQVIGGKSYSQGLPAHIAERMRDSAAETLASAGYGGAEIELEVAPTGPSEGCGIVLWAECESGRRLAGSSLGRRGKRAEEVGREAAYGLVQELAAGAAVETHLADQLIVWMALADGPCEFTAARLTDHLRNAALVAEAMTGARFTLEEGPPSWVKCEP